MKLLIAFMSVFAVFLAGIFYWFYQFSTAQMMNDLRQNLMVSASAAAGMIDAEEHVRLYESGEYDDADYRKIEQVLRIVRDSNPRTYTVYTAVLTPGGAPNELTFVAEAEIDALGVEYEAAAPEMLKAFEGMPTADTNIREDEYGLTLSGYAPILDKNDEVAGIVCVDMDASDVYDMQKRITLIAILVCIIAFASVFAVVFIASGMITRPLSEITAAARILHNDQPYEPTLLDKVAEGTDEIGILARIFDQMAEKMYARQEELKREVAQLKIEIDQTRRQKEVKEIVDSDYFQDLKAKSESMRKRRQENKKEE
jgi:methyl-accepting chemotaxis protein